MVLDPVGQTFEDSLQRLKVTFIFRSLLKTSEPHGLKASWPHTGTKSQ